LTQRIPIIRARLRLPGKSDRIAGVIIHGIMTPAIRPKGAKMAYLFCVYCGQDHRNILQRDMAAIAVALQEGDAQIVTKQGIESQCILKIIGRVSRSEFRIPAATDLVPALHAGS
jgi:hypothetical protein